MNLQEHYIKKALTESNIKYDHININHSNGNVWVDNKEHPLIFPNSMIELCESMWCDKIHDYYFSGVIAPNRQWIEKYKDGGVITNSNRGRDDALKYEYDVEYYRNLCKTRFALAPIGECPWSYRLHEAVMCKAVPVIGDDDHDVTADGYFFYRDSDVKIYKEWMVERNLLILKSKHSVKIFS